MNIDPQCVPCLLKRVLFEADLTTVSEQQKTRAVQAACAVLAKEYDPHHCSAVIATRVHQAVYDILGDHDPYQDLKQRSTREALALAKTVEHLIDDSKDRLKTSLLCAVIANMLDFGIEGAGTTPEMLRSVFDRLYKEGFGYDDYPTFTKLLRSTHRLLFFTDNCGEHVFDKILCRELRRAYPRLSITLVVKGVPILSDATMADAKAIQFSESVDAILTTESFAVGVPVDPIPTSLFTALDTADLVLSKGMANYESLSEIRIHHIAHLLRTKCKPIAASLHLPVNISALKVVE